MASTDPGAFGYQGRWAWVDLTTRRVRVEPADQALQREYVGGRGVQARVLHDHLRATGPITDPFGPENRVVLGTGPLNDTPIATAGRGSCTFISPMTRSPVPAPWIPGHEPLFGLLTHASAGGAFANMIKRAGFDQVIIDGRADRPVRLFVTEDGIRVIDAEDDLFETRGGERVTRPASTITDLLARTCRGASTLAVGPAGWNRVAFACLTNDHHRNFGRGGAGAVFGSKNLVAVTAYGRRPVRAHDPAACERLGRELDRLVQARVADPAATASFRPATGTTWWLDRAFDGGYLGQSGGYLPWHNFDEGSFDPADYARAGTAAFREIAGRHRVCNRCRHVTCTRDAAVAGGPFAGTGVRPEFETIALWINCGLLDRDAIFHLNRLANDLGIDTMTLAGVTAAAMELGERGLLGAVDRPPAFGCAADAIRVLEAIAYRADDLGRLLGQYSDAVVAGLAAARPPGDAAAIARAVTTAFGGLGYAGVEPKVFPGMFVAYATSNRGRGDHTYAWTIQAEEGGLTGAGALADHVASGQAGKALVDSLGLCDFFPEDVFSDVFLAFHRALTGIEHDAETFQACGARIYTLERLVNTRQGRARAYDAYVPPKFTAPLTRGAHRGRAIRPEVHQQALDAYYVRQGWTADGRIASERLAALGIDP